MARSHIEEDTSSYYPPRARWYSGIFYPMNWLRRHLALDRLTLPSQMKAGALVAGFLVPGLAVRLRGPRLLGNAALGVSALLLLIFIIGLGYPAGNLAFGLLISIHVTGFVYYCHPLLAGEAFRFRLAFTLLVLLGIWMALYLPGRNFVQGHWLTPLRLNGQVIVVQRLFSAHIQRGDWIAYGLSERWAGEAHNGGAVWVHEGMSLGTVLALAGDRVAFDTNGFSVNGKTLPALPNMPATGGFTVPENHWFVWPNLDISGHGNIGGARLASVMLGLADVSEEQYFGKPLHHWFGRKQILP